MNPSFDVRLAAVIRVLETVVLPAVDGAMAQHLGALSLGHLRILRDQLDHGPRYDLLEFRASRALAEEVAMLAEGEESVAAALQAMRQAASAPECEDGAAVRAALRALDGALEDFVRASGAIADADKRAAIRERVLAHGKDRAMRGRSFFQGMGFEFEPIAGVEDMLAQLERAYPPAVSQTISS